MYVCMCICIYIDRAESLPVSCQGTLDGTMTLLIIEAPTVPNPMSGEFARMIQADHA